MNAILAIAHNTFREGVRNKVLWAAAFFAVLALGLSIALSEMAVRENVRLLRDLGLAGVSLFGVIAAVFLGVNLLYKELALRTVYAIVPKPIRRWQLVVGKYLGMAATVLALLAALAAVLVALLAWQQAGPDGDLVRALVLVALETLVLCGIGVFFSSWSTPYLSGLFTLGVFVLGRSAEDIERLGAQVSGALRVAVEAIAAAVPNLYLFYPTGGEVGGRQVTVLGEFVGWGYVGSAALYAAACIAVLVTAAAALLSRRDFL